MLRSRRLARGRFPTSRLLHAAIVLAVVGAGAAAATQTSTGTMRGLLDALVVLLPASVASDSFESAANHDQIDAALENLARNARVLERHGLGLNPSYQRAGATLAEDALEALNSFRGGAPQTARFIVANLTENCFACHSRLPAGERPEIAALVGDAIDLDALTAGDRLRLLVATRQFEAAMQYAERLLANEAMDAADLDMLGIFESYLKVSVRVARDLDRPRRALWSFVQRDDLPTYLATQAGAWLDALEEIRGLAIEDELVQARELLEESRRRNLYMQDRRGLVHATVASALLHQYVQAAPTDPIDIAEAYYLLGLAESAISTTIWTPETEFFLESAMRAAPSSAAARDAYVFLEQYVIAMHTGSAGTDVPNDVSNRLMALRALVFGSPGGE